VELYLLKNIAYGVGELLLLLSTKSAIPLLRSLTLHAALPSLVHIGCFLYLYYSYTLYSLCYREGIR
jgi:hypothetical protein